MARVKLSEYRAKSLLVNNYSGTSIHLDTIEQGIDALDDDKQYVIKVDQGIKKRGKQGLIRLNVAKNDVESAVHQLSEKGFSRFIAEPMLEHDDSEERYVSFELTRDGIVVQYSDHGGIDVEDNADTIKTYTLANAPLPRVFVDHVATTMNTEYLSFVEINPLVVRGNECLLLDAAVLVDSAGEYAASWSEEDVVEAYTPDESESAIAELNHNSPAAFSFRVLNPNGSIWLLLSGGGASITIADEAMNQGKALLVGNYGEYSGGPSAEETYLYTVQVLRQLLVSDADEKALVIAGGVANFTDIEKTFGGVIKALRETKNELVRQRVRVYVRRGGPNEVEGLAMMQQFLKDNGLYGSVHGSDIVLTDVINEALEYVDA